jgi:hypothetical protein
MAFVGQEPLDVGLRQTSDLDQVELWDTRAGRLARTLPSARGNFLAAPANECGLLLAVHPAGHTLALGRADLTLVTWDLGERLPQPVLHERFGHLSALAYSPDGQTLLAGTDRAVYLHRTADLARTGELWHSWPVVTLAVGSGNCVAVAVDSAAILWDHHTQKQGPRWEHDESVVTLAFAPEGTLFTGTDKGIVRVWHPGQDEPVAVFDWQVGPIAALAVSPDGMTAAIAAGTDVLVWDREG